MVTWEACRRASDFVLFFNQMKAFFVGLAFALAMAFLESVAAPEPPAMCVLMPSFDASVVANTTSCTNY